MIRRNRHFEKGLGKRLALHDERARAGIWLKIGYLVLDLPFRAASFFASGSLVTARAFSSLYLLGLLSFFSSKHGLSRRPEIFLGVIAFWALGATVARVQCAWSRRSKLIELFPISTGKTRRERAGEFFSSAGFVFIEFFVVYSMLASLSSHSMKNLAGVFVFAFLQAIVFTAVSLLLVALKINSKMLVLFASLCPYVFVFGFKHVHSVVGPSFWLAFSRWNPFGWLNTVFFSGWMNGQSGWWASAALAAGMIATLPLSFRAFRRMQQDGTIPWPYYQSPFRPIVRSKDQTEPAVTLEKDLRDANPVSVLDLRERDFGLVARIFGRFLSKEEVAISDAINRKLWKWGLCFSMYLVCWITYGSMDSYLRQVGPDDIENLQAGLGSKDAQAIFVFGIVSFAGMPFSAMINLLWLILEVPLRSSRVLGRQNWGSESTYRAIHATRMLRLFPLTHWEVSKLTLKINSLALLVLILHSLFLPRAFFAGVLLFGEGHDHYLLTKLLILVLCLSLIGHASMLDACRRRRFSIPKLLGGMLAVGGILIGLGLLGFGFLYSRGFLLPFAFGSLLLSAAGGLLWFSTTNYLRKC